MRAKKSNIHFQLTDKLATTPNFEQILEDFKFYKRNSNPQEHPRPANHFQKKYDSVSYYFGRDKFDTRHAQARKEEIQHVHYREQNSNWENSNGNPKSQWQCTSNTYLVYSYFYHDNINYYYLIDFINKSAHNDDNAIYRESITTYLDKALAYRLSVVNAASMPDR